MKVWYIGVIRRDPKPAHELCAVKELSTLSFFNRSPVSQFMTLFSCTVAEKAETVGRHETTEGSYVLHSYVRSEGIVGIVITDREYPKLVAHRLLSQVVDEFLTLHTRAKWASESGELLMPQLNEYIVKFQDPQQADSMLKIQQELDETKITLHKTIESMLERGEKIDNLVARSEGLSSASKMFYHQAKKQNSCCVIT